MGRPRSRSSDSHALAAARRAHQAGDLVRAERLYADLLQSEPGNAQAWYLLGVARQGLGKLDDAAAALREAVRLAPGRDTFHNHLGVVLAAQRRFAEAQ